MAGPSCILFQLKYTPSEDLPAKLILINQFQQERDSLASYLDLFL